MKIVSNNRLIERNRKIGRYLSLGSLVVLGVGLYTSFAAPEATWIYFAALIIGFITSQIGIYYGSRWGKSPRPDERLTAALKGLDDRYTLYHYSTPVSHFLLGPAGALALLPLAQKGSITYDPNRKRWTQRGGSWFMKVFGQEGLGRPDTDARNVQADLTKMMQSSGSGSNLSAETVLVFTDPNVELEAPEALFPVVKSDKLKDYIRRRAKEINAPADIITLVEKQLPAAEKERKTVTS